MDEGLRSEPQFQGVIDAGQMFFARADHPVTESATADRNPGALECLRQPVERRAIDIFVNEREGQRRCRDDARQSCAGIGAITIGVLIPVRSQWRQAYLSRTFCRTFAFTSI